MNFHTQKHFFLKFLLALYAFQIDVPLPYVYLLPFLEPAYPHGRHDSRLLVLLMSVCWLSRYVVNVRKIHKNAVHSAHVIAWF